jgi:hypothetical protein
MALPSRTYIRTGHREFDDLVPLVRSFLAHDVLNLSIDGQEIRGYRTPDARSVWIRDHSDMMRAFRYFEEDMKSAVQHFADTQAASGRIFDYFTTFPEKLPSERENWTKYVRVPVEADVEYRFVKGAYLAWQATGDDDWIRRLLPSMERALQYIMNHRWYWDEPLGLVKRAYTIDTWDFAYTAGGHEWLQFQITDKTFWGIMHGDNSGYYEAFRIMATLHRRLDDPSRSEYWDTQAEALRERMNRVCWNGEFYTHFVKLTPVTIAGVEEAGQLSLSNPMDINRGTASHSQAVSILREYQARRAAKNTFAEWFSIDPPFPDGVFGDERLVAGAYCNGGIMPLVGGELARAAFDHGFEAYGVDILRRYFQMISEKGETYLWYFPDGSASSVETSTSPEATPTDGWGSSAMLWALVEGLAGVVDCGRGFDRALLAPRWIAAGVNEAEVSAGYESSGRGIRYAFEATQEIIRLNVSADRTDLRCHILLPQGAEPHWVKRDGDLIEFSKSCIEASPYVDFEGCVESECGFEIAFAK